MHAKILQKEWLNFNLYVQFTWWFSGNARDWVREVPCSISGSGKDFYVFYFALLCFVLFIYILFKTHYLSLYVAISFAMLIYLV